MALVYRRRNYALFYYTHHLAIGVLVTVLLHAWWYVLYHVEYTLILVSYGNFVSFYRFRVFILFYCYSAWYVMLPPLLFWLMDKFLRLDRTRTPRLQSVSVLAPGVTNLIMLQCEALSCGGFNGGILSGSGADARTTNHFAAGQYVWISVPEISMMWHPFSISSSPHSAMMSLHVRDMGPGKFTHGMLLRLW